MQCKQCNDDTGNHLRLCTNCQSQLSIGYDLEHRLLVGIVEYKAVIPKIERVCRVSALKLGIIVKPVMTHTMFFNPDYLHPHKELRDRINKYKPKKRKHREIKRIIGNADYSNEKPIRNPMQPKVRKFILHRDNYTCQHCGIYSPCDADPKLHIDHIRPVSKWGSDELLNLQVLCMPCNMKKFNHYEGTTNHE